MNVKTLPLGPVQANCYIVTKEDRAIVIDPGDLFDFDSILAQGPYTLEAILLTHAHFDHIQGVDAIIRSHPVPVYIHPQEIAFLKDPSLNASTSFYEMVSIQAPALPLKQGKMKIADFEIEVLFTPGHSCGSTCFIIENALFSGDTLFQYSIGRTDLPTGSLMEMKESLIRLSSLDDQLIVYPGHGPKTTIGQEKRMNPYLLSL